MVKARDGREGAANDSGQLVLGRELKHKGKLSQRGWCQRQNVKGRHWLTPRGAPGRDSSRNLTVCS